MLVQRVITACVMLVVLVGSLLISPLAFIAVAAASVGACLWEWLRLVRVPSALAAVIGAAVAAFFFWLEYATPAWSASLLNGQALWLLSAAGTLVWAILTAVVFFKRVAGWQVPIALGLILAFIVVPAAWFSLMYLYRVGGVALMVSVLALVWVADIMAYFTGRAFGGPKMSPGISPKKTWSGAIGAFVCVLGLAWVLALTTPAASLWTNVVISKLSIFASGLIMVIAVLFSIAGDLFESAIKRTAGIKDSSNLLPGHGGFYDRLDAQLAVLPLSVFVLLTLQGF